MYAPQSHSAGIYIHIPFCVKKCGYCSFVSYEGHEEYYDKYVHSLIKEIRKAEYKNRNVDTIFFGGGTPSLLKPQHIYSIMETLYDCFDIDKKAEITLESNPGTLDLIKLKDFRNCEINRLSMGIQSLDDNDLKYLGRIHDKKTALQLVKDVAKSGFDNVNIDLIYGLPYRTVDVWQKVLAEALALDITHISMYALTLEDDTPLGKLVKEGKMAEPSDDAAADEYGMIDKINSRFIQYEISNYALPGFECKHNLKYWKREDYYGFGVAAHSSVGRERFANTSKLITYIDNMGMDKTVEDFREVLSDEEIIGETIMLALRTSQGVVCNDIKRVFNVEFKDKYQQEIVELLQEELIEETAEGYRLTKRGRLLGNQVFMRFIA